MPYVNCKLRSEVLQRKVDIQMYFPTDLPDEVGYEPKGTLTLLHGYTNSGDDWVQMSSAARYCADNALVMLCPSCQNSFYQDSTHGAWKTFVTEEMPMLLSRSFIFPHEREHNYIAGLSMGGYGALYLGLSRPDLYSGCASFSGAVDVSMLVDMYAGSPAAKEFYEVFNTTDGTLSDDSNIYCLLERVSKLPENQQPKIFLSNGLQDIPVYNIKGQNDALWSKAKDMPLAHIKRMEWNGVHEWNFWDRSLVYALDYFLENGYAAKKHGDWTAETY